jgi:hypothetical protein
MLYCKFGKKYDVALTLIFFFISKDQLYQFLTVKIHAFIFLIIFFLFKYLNCVVSYEILTLLRNCHNVAGYSPPSLLKVTLQATAVYMFSIIIFIIHYFIGRSIYWWENLYWSIPLTYFFPIIFFIYVWITIKCRGYLSSATGSMKQLVRI